MKISIKITGFIILVFLVSGLVYSLFDANQKINNSYHTNKHLNDLKLLNKDINIILASSNIQNFDNLEKISKNIDYVLMSALYHVQGSNVLKDVKKLANLFEEKKSLINDFKSTDAIVNNSYKNILKLSGLIRKKVIETTQRDNLDEFTNILLQFNTKKNISLKNSIKELKDLYMNNYQENRMMELFIANIEVFDKHYKKLNTINKQNKDIKFEKQIDIILDKYEMYNNNIIQNMELVITIFVFLVIVFLTFLFILSSKLDKKVIDIKKINNKLESSTKELEKSIDIISKNVIYSKSDLKGIIIEVSDAFCKISGYSTYELIGKPHNIIRDPKMLSNVFKELWETIKSGKVWEGEIRNIKKDGSFYWVKASISPQYGKDGDIVSYVAIREDITLKKEVEEYNKNLGKKIAQEVKKNREKDKLIQEQSRLAQMGEMISMIAHQWRQPLGAISSTSMNIQVKLMTYQFDLDTNDGREKMESFLINKLKSIDELVQVLSVTIDDFRNFFKPEKKKELVALTYPIEKALSIVNPVMNTKAIIITTSYQTQDEILMHQNEMMQVVLNILKNSEDNFAEKDISAREIFITTKKENDDYIILISDNGGGIPENIIANIFNPYFSTKTEKNGTGLGLYMSKVIVEEHNDGKLNAFNTDVGVCFEIRF